MQAWRLKRCWSKQSLTKLHFLGGGAEISCNGADMEESGCKRDFCDFNYDVLKRGY